MFTFAKTTSSDFAIAKDAVDTSLEIIVHKATGFLNITKISALVQKLKFEEQATKISADSFREPNQWFANDATKRLIATILRCHPDLTDVKYELAAGTPKRFTGIYLHETAYDHFMKWFDIDYAIRLSMYLRKCHFAAQSKAIEIGHVNELSAKMAEQSAKIAEQSAKIKEFLGDYKQTNKDHQDIKSNLKKIDDHLKDLKDQTKKVRMLTSRMKSMHTMLE